MAAETTTNQMIGIYTNKMKLKLKKKNLFLLPDSSVVQWAVDVNVH